MSLRESLTELEEKKTLTLASGDVSTRPNSASFSANRLRAMPWLLLYGGVIGTVVWYAYEAGGMSKSAFVTPA